MTRIFHWLFMWKMNPMSGFDIRLVFTWTPRCVHLWNNFPCIKSLIILMFFFLNSFFSWVLKPCFYFSSTCTLDLTVWHCPFLILSIKHKFLLFSFVLFCTRCVLKSKVYLDKIVSIKIVDLKTKTWLNSNWWKQIHLASVSPMCLNPSHFFLYTFIFFSSRSF